MMNLIEKPIRDQSPITNHQSPITNQQSPISNQQSAISNQQFHLIDDCRVMIGDF
jgi:hypothetical protein